jgi:hypothetical protein
MNRLAACIACAGVIVAGTSFIFSAGHRAAPAYAQGPSPARIELRSESITLPFGDRQFRGGQWADIANGRCLICHSKGMIDLQPPLPLTVWKSEIAKMRAAYGCAMGDDEVDGLAQFLYELNHRSHSESP